MFPKQNIELANNIQSPEGKISFEFDFSTGDFVLENGKVKTLNGIESIKMWITKALKTEKYRFKIYNTTAVEKYGASLQEIVTSNYPFDFIKAEIQREITDTLLKNSEIKVVDNFIFKRDKKNLNVSFDVSTIYGNMAKEVIIGG